MKGNILNKILNKILIAVIILFILASLFFLYSVYFKPLPALGLKIELIGANEVIPLENYQYKIKVNNGSNKNLSDVNLRIILSEGIFMSGNQAMKEFSFSLGRIEAKKSAEQNLNLFFINEGNFKETIKFILTYKIEDKAHIFEKEDSFSILVKNSPIQAQIFVPTKIYLNQEFQSSFKIINLSNKTLENVKVKIDAPSNFLLISTFPRTEHLYWEFKKLEPKEIKDISIIGQIQDIKSSAIFSAQIDFDYVGKSFSLPKEIAKVNLLDNPVAINISIAPSQTSVPIGSNLLYEVSIKNRSQSVLNEGLVRVKFFGPFDISSLQSDGAYSQIDQSLSWTSREKPELLNIKPGDEIKLRFSISLIQSYPILNNENSKNFIARARVEFKTPTIPIEIEETLKEYIVYQEVEKKISGRLEVQSQAFYGDEFFEASGPLPLANEQPTTFSWHIKIRTIGEDFGNFTLSTRFPPRVNLTGKVGGDAIKENLKFDPKTGVFFYSVNKLDANLGYSQKEMDLVFEVVVTPPALIDPNDLVIVPSLQYSAVGSFSNNEFSGTTDYIKADNITKK
ncbi:MAG: hypothetical protein NZ822_02530 [Patescibacteria group bacterium]|nr:hypothetical protein [Patescibacteria group bacterium]